MLFIEEINDSLTISLEIFVITENYEINEEINVAENYETIIDDITDIIESFGYEVLKSEQSDRSDSLYFTFCFKNEFLANEVNLIVSVRLSDHELPKWDKDNSTQDAKNRQLNNLKQYAHQNRWLNKNLKDDEEIPVDQIYIKYENEFYSTLDDVYKKVREKMQAFTNKHK